MPQTKIDSKTNSQRAAASIADFRARGGSTKTVRFERSHLKSAENVLKALQKDGRATNMTQVIHYCIREIELQEQDRRRRKTA